MLGLTGPGVGMLTAAEVAGVAVCADEPGVRVEATVGLSLPVWAAAPDGTDEARRELEAARRPGTINVVAFVPVRHTDAALANLLCTVTEAKVQALADARRPGNRHGLGRGHGPVPGGRPGRAVRRPALGVRRAGGAGRLRRARRGHAVITLVLGGARSGKSAVAEALVARHAPPVTYVATMDPAGDSELEARVAAHRLRRDPAWETVAVGPGDDLAALVGGLRGTVLVDSLGPWVARRTGTNDDDAAALCAALAARAGDTVLVSDEVGLAVHPSSAAGRHFRDALGALNHAVSAGADAVYLVVAGRPLALPPAGPPP